MCAKFRPAGSMKSWWRGRMDRKTKGQKAQNSRVNQHSIKSERKRQDSLREYHKPLLGYHSDEITRFKRLSNIALVDLCKGSLNEHESACDKFSRSFFRHEHMKSSHSFATGRDVFSPSSKYARASQDTLSQSRHVGTHNLPLAVRTSCPVFLSPSRPVSPALPQDSLPPCMFWVDSGVIPSFSQEVCREMDCNCIPFWIWALGRAYQQPRLWYLGQFRLTPHIETKLNWIMHLIRTDAVEKAL